MRRGSNMTERRNMTQRRQGDEAGEQHDGEEAGRCGEGRVMEGSTCAQAPGPDMRVEE